MKTLLACFSAISAVSLQGLQMGLELSPSPVLLVLLAPLALVLLVLVLLVLTHSQSPLGSITRALASVAHPSPSHARVSEAPCYQPKLHQHKHRHRR